MPALSDHLRRDAQDAARSRIRVSLNQYRRRMEELAKAHVSEAIETATNEGDAIDGIRLGYDAADRVISSFIGSGGPQAAIESGETPGDRTD